jgi:hypothetical protein
MRNEDITIIHHIQLQFINHGAILRDLFSLSLNNKKDKKWKWKNMKDCQLQPSQ